jgi:hypothetical protein
MVVGWVFLTIGLFVSVLYVSVGFLMFSFREEIATEIGTTWLRIVGGSLGVAGLSATLSMVSLAIASFTREPITSPLGETTRDATNPLGATIFGIPFADLSGYFLQFIGPSMGVAIVAMIIGLVVHHG